MIATAFLVLALADAPSGVVTEMTPALVQEAIAVGEKAKESPMYWLRSGSSGLLRPLVFCGSYTTPFARVAVAAYDAKTQYKTLTPADVNQTDLVPELHVHAMGNPTHHGKARADDVKTIVIAPRDSKDRAQVVQPTKFEPKAAAYTNGFGATRLGTEALAIFPLSAIAPDREIRVVYGSWECVVPLDPKKIR